MPPGAENEDKEGRAMSEGVEGARRARYGWGGHLPWARAEAKIIPSNSLLVRETTAGPVYCRTAAALSYWMCQKLLLDLRSDPRPVRHLTRNIISVSGQKSTSLRSSKKHEYTRASSGSNAEELQQTSTRHRERDPWEHITSCNSHFTYRRSVSSTLQPHLWLLLLCFDKYSWSMMTALWFILDEYLHWSLKWTCWKNIRQLHQKLYIHWQKNACVCRRSWFETPGDLF